MKKRRTFTPEFKARVVLEAFKSAKADAEICRENNIEPELLAAWKAQFLEHASDIFEESQNREEHEKRIAELERLLGQKAMELEIAKKASEDIHPHQLRNGNL